MEIVCSTSAASSPTSPEMARIDREPPDSFVFAHERYSAARSAAFALALDKARTDGVVRNLVTMTPITARAVAAYQAQWRVGHWTGQGGWAWDQLARRFARKPRSFHAALWSGSTLCGLCVGRVSRGRQNLTLHYMESAPNPHHPLRGLVTRLMFEAAVRYGLGAGCRALLLRDPLPGVTKWYEAFGFQLVPRLSGMVYFGRTLV